MKDLKTILFEETLFQRNRLLQFQKDYGDWDDAVAVQKAKFKTCYALLIKAELEEEYENWKAERGEE